MLTKNLEWARKLPEGISAFIHYQTLIDLIYRELEHCKKIVTSPEIVAIIECSFKFVSNFESIDNLEHTKCIGHLPRGNDNILIYVSDIVPRDKIMSDNFDTIKVYNIKG